MKISLVRSGGVAGGIVRQTTLDDADLPPDTAAELREKAAAARGVEPIASAPPPTPGETLYEVTLSDGEEQTARFRDMNLPDSVRKLIEWVDGRPEQKTEFLRPGA
jgi:hypothetical protein